MSPRHCICAGRHQLYTGLTTTVLALLCITKALQLCWQASTLHWTHCNSPDTPLHHQSIATVLAGTNCTLDSLQQSWHSSASPKHCNCVGRHRLHTGLTATVLALLCITKALQLCWQASTAHWTHCNNYVSSLQPHMQSRENPSAFLSQVFTVKQQSMIGVEGLACNHIAGEELQWHAGLSDCRCGTRWPWHTTQTIQQPAHNPTSWLQPLTWPYNQASPPTSFSLTHTCLQLAGLASLCSCTDNVFCVFGLTSLPVYAQAVTCLRSFCALVHLHRQYVHAVATSSYSVCAHGPVHAYPNNPKPYTT